MPSTAPKTYHRSTAVAVRLVLAAVFSIAVATGDVAFAASPASATAPKAPPLTGRLLQSGDWCANYRLGALSAEARVAGPNRSRLLAAEALLAPGFNPGKSVDGIRLLADYQAEMEALRPDRVLAATYLAVASSRPINLALIEHVNRLLCVTASSAVAKGVALIADAEWREMSR